MTWPGGSSTASGRCVDGLCVLDSYMKRHRNKPPPALRPPTKSLPRRRSYTQVHPVAIWRMQQIAEDSGCSLAAVTRSRRDDPDASSVAELGRGSV